MSSIPVQRKRKDEKEWDVLTRTVELKSFSSLCYYVLFIINSLHTVNDDFTILL